VHLAKTRQFHSTTLYHLYAINYYTKPTPYLFTATNLHMWTAMRKLTISFQTR